MKHILQCFSFVCVLIILSNLLIETFVNPILVYKVEQSNKLLTIYNNTHNINKYTYDINNIKFTNDKGLLSISNILDLNKKDKILSVIEEYNILLFIIQKQVVIPTTFAQIVKSNVPIYTESKQSNNTLFSALVNSLSLKYTNIKFINGFPKSQLNSGSAIMLFDTINNISRVMKDYTDYDIIDYDNINIHIFKALVPPAFTQNLDMSTHLTTYKSTFPIKKIICLDNIITTNDEEYMNKHFTIEASTLISNIGLIEKNNFLAMMYPYCKLTLMYMRRYNKYIEHREDLPILEQFIEEKQTYTPKHNIDGFYDNKNKTFIIFGNGNNVNIIDGIPILSMKYINFKNQDRDEENGLYEVKSNSLVKVDKENRKEKRENDDNDYVCFDNPMIKNKLQCESKVDENGATRKKTLFWDKPCKTNDECPFYQANTKYMNYRGGCNDGYCEFPLGIERLAYRIYTSKPICHGCPLNNIYCCDDQKVKDYAFELDHIERLRIKDIK
jgi:hypothetical protein